MSAKRQMSGWLVAVAAAAPMDNDVRPCPTPALICGWLIRFAMTTLKPPQARWPSLLACEGNVRMVERDRRDSQD
jgi:hypothetical protein